MSELKLRRRGDSELLYVNQSPVGGVCTVAVGAVVAFVSCRAAGTGSWLAMAVGILFVLAGIFAVFWRDELQLDLIQRQYRRRRGFWPSAQLRAGFLDQAACLALVEDVELRRGRKRAEWEVWLELGGNEQPVRLRETRHREKAQRALADLGSRLAVEVVDRTGARRS